MKEEKNELNNNPEQPKQPDELPIKEKVKQIKQGRTLLRQIRAGVFNGNVSPDDLQEFSTSIIKSLGDTLIGNTSIEDFERICEHLTEITGTETISKGGADISSLVKLTSTFAKNRQALNRNFGLPDENTLVMPLSSGPALLAEASVRHDFVIYVAAVSPKIKGKSEIILPSDIPKDKPVIVMDDVVGDQARLTDRTLRELNYDVINCTQFFK